MEKISIIIGIYNGEKYIKRCLDSILQQTVDNFEIIIINDGSTDNSLNILRKYEKKDKRIIIIDKKMKEFLLQEILLLINLVENILHSLFRKRCFRNNVKYNKKKKMLI